MSEVVETKRKVIEWWRVKHFFRDLFMPRWAVLVELHNMPNLEALFDQTKKPYIVAPVVMMVPMRRPFFMPFNVWYNGMREEFGIQTLTICGHWWTLPSMYKGSTNRNNMKRAWYYYPKGHPKRVAQDKAASAAVPKEIPM